MEWSEGLTEALKGHFTPPGHIAVFFKCRVCGLEKIPVNVEARKQNEDLGRWMKKALRAIHVAHTIRSMACQATKIDLIMPVAEAAEWIGQEPKKPPAEG